MQVHHIAITVNSLSESQSFYEKFGFTKEKEFERKDLEAKAIFLKLKNIRLEIWEFDSKENINNLNNLNVIGIRHIALQVENLEETITSLGLAFSKPKLGASGHRYSFTKDPNGIPIELYEAE